MMSPFQRHKSKRKLRRLFKRSPIFYFATNPDVKETLAQVKKGFVVHHNDPETVHVFTGPPPDFIHLFMPKITTNQ